jgi:hypothetical protein
LALNAPTHRGVRPPLAVAVGVCRVSCVARRGRGRQAVGGCAVTSWKLVAGDPLRGCTAITLPSLRARALPQAQASPRGAAAPPQKQLRGRQQIHSRSRPSFSPAIGPTPGYAILRQHPACQGVCHPWAGLLLDQGLCAGVCDVACAGVRRRAARGATAGLPRHRHRVCTRLGSGHAAACTLQLQPGLHAASKTAGRYVNILPSLPRHGARR